MIDMLLNFNKEMIEELKDNKQLMNINKEDQLEMQIDKLYLI